MRLKFMLPWGIVLMWRDTFFYKFGQPVVIKIVWSSWKSLLVNWSLALVLDCKTEIVGLILEGFKWLYFIFIWLGKIEKKNAFLLVSLGADGISSWAMSFRDAAHPLTRAFLFPCRSCQQASGAINLESLFCFCIS